MAHRGEIARTPSPAPLDVATDPFDDGTPLLMEYSQSSTYAHLEDVNATAER